MRVLSKMDTSYMLTATFLEGGRRKDNKDTRKSFVQNAGVVYWFLRSGEGVNPLPWDRRTLARLGCAEG